MDPRSTNEEQVLVTTESIEVDDDGTLPVSAASTCTSKVLCVCINYVVIITLIVSLK